MEGPVPRRRSGSTVRARMPKNRGPAPFAAALDPLDPDGTPAIGVLERSVHPFDACALLEALL